MNKKAILDTIKKVREVSKKRNFTQSFDLIINLTQLDLKDPSQKIDLFVQLPKQKGKNAKICALVGPELESKAKIFDKVIVKDEFPLYQKDVKKVKKLAREYDYFVAQANLMADIATAFGKGLGTMGKMPNPKAGCIVPPNIPSLEPLKTRLNNTVRLLTKNQPIVKAMIGTESMKDEDLAENIQAVYNSLLNVLPKDINNIRSIYLKLTMGPAVQLTDKGPILKKQENKEENKKETKENETKAATKKEGS
jgi:large subunit ribosomal protein L1